MAHIVRSKEMSATSVIGAGTHPAVKNKRRPLTREPKAIRELHVQLHDMRNAAKPFLTDEARKVYWAQAWERTVVRAATRVESNRKQFYGLRLAAIISAITVPSLRSEEHTSELQSLRHL